MGNNLMPNERFAETEEEEAVAEAREQSLLEEKEDIYGDDSDRAYEQQRDDDANSLMEGVKELIDRLSKLMYYRNRAEGLAKDLIQRTLDELKFKIESVETISPYYQSIKLIKKEK